ncbi:GPI ethanolamine phosphate transferase 3 [Neocloeon triangulifer]|uniref:GPI ethanolamine phosphate transferase 3 n=1 Tax=Neocloeon triangulifer TaxID=2078957 RepID=UPI00286F5A01|nr:GPI ethanolamine phosphate transferase 3 [Neocloeon triangulifer]
MDAFGKQLALMCWFFYLLSASVVIFLGGFLLSRDEFTDRASCVHRNSAHYTDELNLQICTESKNNRAVLLIVDALMFEFADFDPKNAQPLAFQNKITIFRDLLQAKPNNSRLFKFIADPPTTTMQRLKGLTTGSLPTFIDAGSNFASSEIFEDNFLDQLKNAGKNVIFMGDDTWTSLYPGRFYREFPFPSFNVWDLDTVDQGVTKHMEPELKRNDWDLIIGHFLGVDHCGHRYGPDHPEMSRKLKEMDKFIKSLVKILDNDTTLIVIGDHGMTSTGNHGGDSVAEVTAAMFIHSPSTLLFPPSGEPASLVMQVDLVPTLTSILSVPIPFSNLGTVVTEALPYAESDWPPVFTSLLNNVNQVHQYISMYHSKKGQFSEEAIARLSREHMDLALNATKVKTAADFHTFVLSSRSYLKSVKQMCEEVWVQFDLLPMALGCLCNFFTASLLLILLNSVPIHKMQDFISLRLCQVAFILISVISVVGWIIFRAFLEISCSLSLLCIFYFLYLNKEDSKILFQNLTTKGILNLSTLTVAVVLVAMFGLGSDNFVVEEGFAVSLLIAILIAALFLNWKERSQKPSQLFCGLISYQKLTFTAFITAFLFLVWSLSLYWQCREEQSWCQSIPSTDLNSKTSPYQQVSFVPLVFHVIPVLANWYWLKRSGNLVSATFTAHIVTYLPILTTILSIIYWVLESLPAQTLKKTIQWDLQILPQTCYVLIFVSLLCLSYDPLLIHIVNPREQVLGKKSDFVPYIFNQVKSALSKNNGQKDVCAVYGLSTAFSSSSFVAILLLYQLLALLQGSKMVPALVMSLCALVLLLAITSMSRLNSIIIPGQLIFVPWFSIVAWALLSVVAFYGTGHNATFPGIQWQAAFVGTSGHFSSNFIPGLMVIVSTFSAQILLGIALPLLMVVPLTLVAMHKGVSAKQDIKEKAANSEMFLYEKSTLCEQSLFMLCSKYILVHFLRISASVFTSFILRRHLMVWKVFAPKLIFEAVSLLVSMIAVIVGYLFFMKVFKTVDKLMVKLEEKQSV